MFSNWYLVVNICRLFRAKSDETDTHSRMHLVSCIQKTLLVVSCITHYYCLIFTTLFFFLSLMCSLTPLNDSLCVFLVLGLYFVLATMNLMCSTIKTLLTHSRRAAQLSHSISLSISYPSIHFMYTATIRFIYK